MAATEPVAGIRSRLCTALTAVALVAANTCAAQGVPARGTVPLSGKILISGASTMTPMMAAVGKRFSSMHPGVQIEVQTVGTAQGVENVTSGKADIGMASRALTDKESGLYSFAIARDGVCLVVHKNNPVRSLTNRQVSDIFTGQIDNWSKVGGRDAPISPINAMEGLGAVELFTHFFNIRYSAIKSPIVANNNLERVKVITENPNGIGYMSFGIAQNQADAGAPIKLLPVDGVAATTKNIRSGNYPISRPLLLVTKAVPAGLVKAFINFSLSSQITDIVLQHEFVPYLD